MKRFALLFVALICFVQITYAGFDHLTTGQSASILGLSINSNSGVVSIVLDVTVTCPAGSCGNTVYISKSTFPSDGTDYKALLSLIISAYNNVQKLTRIWSADGDKTHIQMVNVGALY